MSNIRAINSTWLSIKNPNPPLKFKKCVFFIYNDPMAPHQFDSPFKVASKYSQALDYLLAFTYFNCLKNLNIFKPWVEHCKGKMNLLSKRLEFRVIHIPQDKSIPRISLNLFVCTFSHQSFSPSVDVPFHKFHKFLKPSNSFHTWVVYEHEITRW